MSGILEGLTIVASHVVEKLKVAVTSANVPSEIRDNITIDEPRQEGEGYFYIDIVINHPATLAFEYGSGIHATKGEVGTYPIVPKEKSALAFPWQPDFIPWSSPKFIGFGSDDRFLFRRVDHPGVAPRPFIAPTVKAEMPEVKKILGTFVKAEILAGRKTLEVIDVKG